jgi:hypothetical protein
MNTRHLRRRASTFLSRGRAWSPRVMNRIPRFRRKPRIKCKRRFVFVREPDDTITMRRAICRSYRRLVVPNRKAA